MEKERVAEREPLQREGGEHYEEALRLCAAARKRARTGKIVLKGREIPWRQSRQALNKTFLSFHDNGASMIKELFMMSVKASAALLMISIPCFAAAAEPPFYQGKTITLIFATAPGGTGTLRGQAVTKYLQKHLSGNPAFVFQHMPAGGGTAAANYVANAAKADGLTIGNAGTAIYSSAIFGAAGVRYKLDDFIYLGSPSALNPMALIIRPGLELNTVEKLKAHVGLRFANRSAGHSLYVIDRIFGYVLELREPKWILGYSDPELDLVLERREADTLVNNVRSLIRDTPQWVKKDYSFPVLMKDPKGRAGEVVPAFPQGRPTLDQYADTELKKAVLQLNNASRPGTAVFFVHKGIPKEALRALREAFDKVWKDPEFPKEYERFISEPADPITGQEIERALQNMPSDPKVMEVYKQLIGTGPLPPAR